MIEVDEAQVRRTLEARSGAVAAPEGPASHAGRVIRLETGNPEVDRVLPAFLIVIVWLLCVRLMEAAPPYARGLTDGAFALLSVRVAWSLRRSFQDSVPDRALLRSGVLRGLVASIVVLVAVIGYLAMR